jgi:hypothetical protein
LLQIAWAAQQAQLIIDERTEADRTDAGLIQKLGQTAPKLIDQC